MRPRLLGRRTRVLAISLIAVAACWLGQPLVGSPMIVQQGGEAEFASVFRDAVDKLDKVQGILTTRRVAAMDALKKLESAEGLVSGLPLPRQGLARFFVGVRRAEVYYRLGTELAQAEVVKIGLAVRKRAVEDAAYKTYYRAVLLNLLSRSMGEHEFLSLLDDEIGDREYLNGEQSTLDVAKAMPANSGFSLYNAHLLLLRARVALTRRPAWAVNELRTLGRQLTAYGAAAADLRDECFSRLAWHFMELREFDRARLYLGELKTEDSRYPRAVIDYKQGRFEDCAAEAEKLYEKDAQPRNAQLFADSLERLGLRAKAEGDLDKSRRLLQRALGFYREVERGSAADPQVLAAALNGQGDCHLGLQDFAAASVMYGRAHRVLESRESWTERAEWAETRKDQGRLAERRGEPKKALSAFVEALSAIEEIRAEIPLDALGIRWLEPGQLEAVDGVLRLARAGEVDALMALATVDRMKARGLLDWLVSPPSPPDLDKYRQTLRSLAAARSALDVRERSMDLDAQRGTPQARARTQAVPLDRAQLEKLLDASAATTYLSYWIGQDLDPQRAYLLVATGSDDVRVVDLGPAQTAKARYREAVAAVREPDEDPWKALDACAQFFLPRVVSEDLTPGGRVIVCADSEMGDLPVEAFRVGGSPLGVRDVVYRTPSLSVLARLAERRATGAQRGRRRTLIFDSAEPSASDRALHGVSELEFSEAEGDLVGRAHPDHIRVRRERATLEELEAALRDGSFGTLHVSCHAVVHPRIPSASLLMLHDDPVDMGTLATLPLDDMLVVFSSCSSRGVEDAGGEGLKGLLWGPLAARARAVVASHWEMNQQATKDLMGQFHHHLATGCDEGEAMRRARASLAAAANYAHPAYWAGFGVFVAPPTEAGSNTISFLTVLLAMAGVAVLLLILAKSVLSRRRSAA